jgi:hypothetical protein
MKAVKVWRCADDQGGAVNRILRGLLSHRARGLVAAGPTDRDLGGDAGLIGAGRSDTRTEDLRVRPTPTANSLRLRHGRHIVVVICFALLASACGSASQTDVPPDAQESPVVQGDPDQSDCVRDAYPCSWSEADPAAIKRTDQLMTLSSLLLADNATTEEIATRLKAMPEVAEVVFDKITVWFRVEGAVPVFVFADPTEGGLLEGAFPPAEIGTRADPIGTQEFTGCFGYHDTLADGVEGTVGMPSTPKKALILGPWKWQMDWDVDLMIAKLKHAPSDYALPGGSVTKIMTDDGDPQSVDTPSAFLFPDEPAVRIEDFCGWEKYHTIILKTHGRTICAEVRCHTALSVGRFAETAESLRAYAGRARGVTFGTSDYGNLLTTLSKAEVASCTARLEATPGPGEPPDLTVDDDCLEKLPSGGMMLVTPEFFRANYPGGLKDRLIFLSACQGMKGGELARAIRGSGASTGAILGFDRIVHTSVSNQVLDKFADFVAIGRAIDQSAVKEFNEIIADAYKEFYAHEEPPEVAGRIEGDFTAEEMSDLVPDGSEVTRGSDIVSLHAEPGGPELQNGGKVQIEGRPGDDQFDVLKLGARLTGVGEEGPDAYELQIWLGDRQLQLKEFTWQEGADEGEYVAEIKALALQDLVPDEPITLEIRAVLPDTDGAFSAWKYEDLQVGGGASATITVGGQTWDFVIADGFFGCNVSEDHEEVVASGWVDGVFDITFSAFLRPSGVGTGARLRADNVASIQVNDGVSHQVWMADPTDPAGLNAAIEAIPGGSSQIDTLEIEGSHAWGTATFIDVSAVEKAWSTHGPLPAPLTGSFDVQCLS